MKVMSPLAAVLVDPIRSIDRVASAPRPGRIGLWLGVWTGALGVATLPRQIAALARSLPATGSAVLDAQTDVLRMGLLRLMVVDRLVPSPSLLAAALLLVLAAEPVLMLARDRRRAIWAVVLLGLAPLLVERVGELAISYAMSGGSVTTPGAAIELPHRFVTGLRALWGGAEMPRWVEIADARANLVSLWCMALWAVGLARLAECRLEPWHVALPAACVLAGGVATWVLGPVVVPILLH